MARRDVVKKFCRTIYNADYSIYEAVLIEVRERGATVGSSQLKIGTCARRDVFELGACDITKDPIRQGSFTAKVAIELHQMRQRKKQIFPPVVVEVVNAKAPSR